METWKKVLAWAVTIGLWALCPVVWSFSVQFIESAPTAWGLWWIVNDGILAFAAFVAVIFAIATLTE